MDQIVITENMVGMRLDKALATIYGDYSRSQLKKWLESGYITVNGEANLSPKEKVKLGNVVFLDTKKTKHNKAINFDNNSIGEYISVYKPENISLDIVYQDDDIIIINKPAALVVHPAAGNWEGTLVNGLLYHFPELANIPRAGIVHRLDKDTTGLMVVTRNLKAHYSIVKQLQSREVTRKYIAVVHNNLITSGMVEKNIGRHPYNRLKMAVLDSDNKNSKYALTYYKILKKYRQHTLVELKLATGRTHQIRVHLAHIGYPIVGDTLYGNFKCAPKEFSSSDTDVWNTFRRQALAAVELGFEHPTENKEVFWEIDPPDDMANIINMLERYK